MKRKAQVQGMRTALMLLALFSCLTVAKAEEVTVGDVDTYDYSSSFPMSSYYYSYSQQIYTAEEIGKEGTITSITLWLKGVSDLSEMTFDIYMVETDKGTFDDEQWVPRTVGDKVYSGTLTVHNTSFEPYTFTLDTPFDYSGQGNLMIAFENRTGTYHYSSYLKGKIFQKDDSYMALTSANDDHPFDPDDHVYWAGSWKKYRNVIKLNITPSPIAWPDIVTATDITYQGATLNWTGGTGKYNVEYRKADTSTWTNAKKGLTSTTLPLYNLEQNTTYKVRVQSVSGAVVSGWRSTTFTTPMLYDAPVNFACTAVTATTATLSWADDDTFSSWQICLNDNESNIIDASSNTYTLQGLTPETTYSAKVRGIGEEGHGIWSDPIRFEPTAKLVIGYGLNSSSGLPILWGNKYSLTQQIYTASELGGAATIQSIDFYNVYKQFTYNMDVYMVYTDKSSFTSFNDLIQVTAGDLVFSGSVNFAEDAWTTIELDKPFVYDGQRNVVIIVDNNTGKSHYTEFRCFNTQSQQSFSTYSYEDIDPSCFQSNFYNSENPAKNQIRVKKVNPTVEMPQSLTVGNITFSEADLTWTGGTGKYKVAFKKDGEETWTYSAEKTQQSYHLYNLEENTTYKVRVQSVGQGGAVSLWSTVNFTTPYRYPAPSNLAYTSLTSSSATLCWTENGTANAWEICLNNDDGTIVTADNNNEFPLSDLTEDATYSVKVRAVYGEDKSLWSDAVIFEPTDKLLIGTYMDTSEYLPIYIWGYTSLSQQIYTKKELGDAGSIVSIDFFNTSSSNAQKLDIYMVSTDKSSFGDENDMVAYTDADLVYSGEVNFHYNEWTTITLQYPFEYDGQHNVVIVVDNITGNSSYGSRFRAFDAPGQALYKYVYNHGLVNSKNQIRLVKEASHTVQKPQNFTVSSLSATAAELTWTGGGGRYNVEYKKESDETWTRVFDNKNYTTCDLVSLEQNTNYIARVQSVSGNAVSGWLPIRFTTPILYAAPVNLACTAVTATTATMSWTEKGSARAWQICLNDDEEHLVSANSNPFTLTGLTAETVYTAKVRSLGTEGHGVWSTPISLEPTEKMVLGSGSEKSSNLPTATYYNYSLTEQIYTKEELGDPATFTSIDFYNTSSSARTRQLDIYMMYTDKSGFSATSDLAYPTSTYRVFRGEVTFEADAWTTITLEKPFAYDGESNVVMVIDDNTGSYSSSSYFRTYPANKQAVYIYSDNTDFDPAIQSSYNISNYKNQIRIAKSDYPATPIPQMLTATDITPTSATISWRGIAEKFRVEYGVKGSWLRYDNGNNSRRIGGNKGTTYKWGMRYPADKVTGDKLMKVAFYEPANGTDEIKLTICSVDDKDKPDTSKKIFEVDVTPEAANAFHELKLNGDNGIEIPDKYKNKPLCVILETKCTEKGQYVRPSCHTDAVEDGTQWIYEGYNWKELKDYGAGSVYNALDCWMIRLYIENSSLSYKNGSSVNKNSLKLTGLTPETTYRVRVRSTGSSTNSAWQYVNFTTLSSLAEPNSLAVDNITHNSAKLSWTGYQEKFNIRLRTTAKLADDALTKFTQVGEDITTVNAMTKYTFDLSDYSGTGAIAIRHYNVTDMMRLAIDDISLEKADGTTIVSEDFENGSLPNDWIFVDNDGDGKGWKLGTWISGGYGIYSASWDGVPLTPDNWIIIPNVELGGTLTLYARGTNNSYPAEKFGVFVSTADDLMVPSETTYLDGITGSSRTLNDLKPGTTYSVQVQGVSSSTDKTKYSASVTFTTNCLPGDVNGDGSVTPADAIMILYHYFNVKQNGFIKAAADVNGDGNISPADAIEALYIYFGAGSGKAREGGPIPTDGPEPE